MQLFTKHYIQTVAVIKNVKHICPWFITITGWLQPGYQHAKYNCPSADQQRETHTAPDLTLFCCLTENSQVLHETDNTANDWSDWDNYRDRSGVQTIVQHLLTVAMNEHD